MQVHLHVIPRDDSQADNNKPVKFSDNLGYERNPVEMAEEAENYR